MGLKNFVVQFLNFIHGYIIFTVLKYSEVWSLSSILNKVNFCNDMFLF